VVVSDAGGLPEVVRDGVTGFVVPEGDPVVAARRVEQLLADPEACARMGAAGRAFVVEHFERSRCVDRMIAVLQQAADT
jgi:glycosyltransferase involved in cell wall biosynthesis